MFNTPSTIRLTCAAGQAPMLESELDALDITASDSDATGVQCEGTLEDCMRLNLHLRTAMSVLYRLDAFVCRDSDQLHTAASALAWEDMIPADGYVTVTSTVRNDTIRNTMFANVRLKDAIVDRIRAKVGRRPDAGPDRTGIVVHLHWFGDNASIWIDTSGRKLSDRGYRRMPHLAPMRETLAAAILLHAGFDATGPLVVPMCGSGTIAIEGALVATGRPPGLLRSAFGFQHLLGFDPNAWNVIRAQARPRRSRRAGPAEHPQIIATDIDPQAVEATRHNARTAGVDHLIEASVCDFADTPMPQTPGTIVLHPEYGLRLGDTSSLEPLYARMGDFLKQHCANWSSWIFTGNLQLAKRIGLKAAARVPMRHANVDARLLRYDIWDGSRTQVSTNG